jgi:protein-tyrosine-phosphatase
MKENRNISSVLFCCNYNSVRSPMAEGVFKKLIGRKIFVQSAGVFDTLEIDGFTVKVCDEINVKLSKHRVRSLREMEREGGFIGSFDLIIPLTKESSEEVYKYSTYSSVMIEDWIVDEPIKDENDINQTLYSYRMTRDIIVEKVKERFQDYF